MATTKKLIKQCNQAEKSNITKLEGNDTVLIDLGLFSYNPIEDKKINEDLIEFLKSKGHPPAKIQIRK